MGYRKTNSIKKIFDIYTSDLSFKEIERTLKHDAAEVYEYFKADMPKEDVTKSKFSRAFIFIRSLLNAFLLKLTPARRLFYFISMFLFIFGIVQGFESYLIISILVFNFLLALELVDKLLTKDELQLAKKIQSNLTPQPPFLVPGYETSAFYESAREIGGDYFDIIHREKDDKTFLVIGDISGKGTAAALYMVRVQSILHMLISSGLGVKEIVIDLKNYFGKNLYKEFFLTLTLAEIDGSGKITHCRAGHNPIMHYRESDKSVELYSPVGMGIGLNDKGTFEKTLEVKEITTHKGDIIVFYTDGVTEAMNEIKKQYGQERLIKVIKGNAEKNTDEIKTALNNSLEFFRGDYPQNDDVTYIIIKKN